MKVTASLAGTEHPTARTNMGGFLFPFFPSIDKLKISVRLP
jgi:hypothetical protein